MENLCLCCAALDEARDCGAIRADFHLIWNDYFWAIVLTQGPDAQPVTAGITAFNSQYRAAYHMMSAGSIVAAIPPVFMFFLMQKHFIAGLTLGAVK